MRKLGLQAIYAKPRTTIINKNHQKFPYLLRDLEINQANQVWSVDITYIKTPRGFVYLVALIDIFSRFVVSAKLSISMDTGFCLEILAKALKKQRPQIINSDQGSQFTSNEWVNSLASNNIKISMDGVGRWADNIYIERFWRTIKQEEIYINPSDNLDCATKSCVSPNILPFLLPKPLAKQLVNLSQTSRKSRNWIPPFSLRQIVKNYFCFYRQFSLRVEISA
jgi:transposase InsO family protein